MKDLLRRKMISIHELLTVFCITWNFSTEKYIRETMTISHKTYIWNDEDAEGDKKLTFHILRFFSVDDIETSTTGQQLCWVAYISAHFWIVAGALSLFTKNQVNHIPLHRLFFSSFRLKALVYFGKSLSVRPCSLNKLDVHWNL